MRSASMASQRRSMSLRLPSTSVTRWMASSAASARMAGRKEAPQGKVRLGPFLRQGDFPDLALLGVGRVVEAQADLERLVGGVGDEDTAAAQGDVQGHVVVGVDRGLAFAGHGQRPDF